METLKINVCDTVYFGDTQHSCIGEWIWKPTWDENEDLIAVSMVWTPSLARAPSNKIINSTLEAAF